MIKWHVLSTSQIKTFFSIYTHDFFYKLLNLLNLFCYTLYLMDLFILIVLISSIYIFNYICNNYLFNCRNRILHYENFQKYKKYITTLWYVIEKRKQYLVKQCITTWLGLVKHWICSKIQNSTYRLHLLAKMWIT